MSPQQRGAGAPPVSAKDATVDFHQIGSTVIGVSSMLLCLCVVAVAGRLTVRRISKVALEADDFAAILALLLLAALTAEHIVLAHFIFNMSGTGRPQRSDIAPLGRVLLASQLTYNLLITVVRISILLMYRRIFSLRDRWFRPAWWTSISVVLVFCAALMTITFTQCSPHSVAALWLDPVKCRQSSRYMKIKAPTVAGFVNAAIDICVLLLPTWMVWNLQMTRKRKVLVSCLFSLGLIGVGISIARAVALFRLAARPGKEGVAMACWSIAETAVALLCACLPMQRPLFSRAYDRLISSIPSRRSRKTMSV